MAVIGEASIIVRALTGSVRKDIERAFEGADRIAEKGGKSAADGFRRGFGDGGASSFDAFAEKAEASRVRLRQLANAGRILVPAIAGVIGIIGAAVTGLVVLTSALGNAARTSIVLGAALMSLAQAGITAKLAFKGVGEAISAGNKANEAGTGAADNQTAALRRLRDARIALKRLVEDEAPLVLAEARERAAEAATAAADAVRNSEKATRSYNDSQLESINAINDLNNARDRAREKIQQLRFALEGGAISEKKARLEFEKARDSLQAVQDLPPNSRARQEAELAFAQAELNLRKAIDSNSDLREEEDAATQAGVEGSKDVVDAKDRIARASRAESDAAIAAARAMKQAAEAQMAAQKAATAASAGGAVEKELNRRIADTRQAVKDAEDALKQGAGAVDAYRQALEKLSPEARKFVEFITKKEIQESFKELRASAGRQLFGPLEEAIQNLVDNLFPVLNPLLEETGGVLGGMAKQFSATVTEGENLRRLESVWRTNNGLLTSFGIAVSNLYQGFLILLQAASPLTDALGKWAVRVSDAWVATLLLNEENGNLERDFAGAKGTFDSFATILGNVSRAFGFIGDAINAPGGASESLLAFLELVTGNFATSMEEGFKDGTLQTFFLDSTKNFEKLLELLGDIVTAFLLFGATEGVGQLLDGLIAAVKYFTEIGPELGAKDGPVAAFGDFIDKFSEFSALLLESGGITAFFETLSSALGSMNEILKDENVSAFLEAFAPIIGTIAAFGLLYRAVKFFFEVFFGYLLLGAGVTKFFKGFTQGFKGTEKAAKKGKSVAKNFGRAWGTAAAAAGKKIKSLGQRLANSFLKNGSKAVEAFKKVPGKIGKALQPILGVVGRLLSSVGTYLFKTVPKFYLEAFTKAVGAARTALAPIFNVVKNLFVAVRTYLFTTVPKYWGAAFGRAFTIVKTALSTFFTSIGARLGGFFAKLPGLFMTLLKSIPGKLMGFLARLGPIILQALLRLGPIILRAVAGAVFGIPGAVIAALILVGYLIYKYWDEIVAFFKGLGEWFAKWGSKFWDWLKDAWANYIDYQKARFAAFVDFFRELPGKIAALGSEVFTWLSDLWNAYWSDQKTKFEDLVNFFRELPSNLASIGATMWDWLKDTFKNALNWVIDKWNNFRLTLRIPDNWLTRGAGIAGVGFDIDTPNIPRLARGGVVQPSRGGTIARIGEAGRPERVEPLDPSGLSKRDRAMIAELSGGGAGNTFNIYPSEGMDERELAEMISEKLAGMVRKGGV